MKLLHCSDIHLDIPFGTLFSPEKSAERKQEILSSFDRMVGYAVSIQARVMMITGNLIEPNHIAQRTIERLIDIIVRNPSVDFLLLPGSAEEGNYFRHLKHLPPNLKLFSGETEFLKYENCIICSAISPETLPNFSGNHTINIVMHFGTVDPALWAGRGIDYLALGGSRAYKSGMLGARGYYCHPGSLEALSFEDVGAKGFVEIDTQGTSIAPSFVRSGKRAVASVEVDISSAADDEAIGDLIQKATAGIPGSSMVRVRLYGKVPMERIRNIGSIERDMGKSFFAVRIDDSDVEPEVIAGEVSFDKTLKGEFIRLVMNGEDNAEDKKAIISMGLRALTGGDIL